MNILDQLSEVELYWLDVLEKDEKMLDTLIDKRDRYITDRFINFMKLIIKYDNLKDNKLENGCRAKRVIRIHKNIPVKYLNYIGCEYVIFNGLYIVSEVAFVDKSVMDEYFSSRGGEEIRNKLNIPNDSLYNYPRNIIIGGERMSVLPIKNNVTEQYIQYVSNWSYPIFSKNGE